MVDRDHGVVFAQRNSLLPPPSLLATPGPGVVDQSPPNRSGPEGQEVGVAVIRRIMIPKDPEIDLVHECGGLQGVVVPFVAKMACRESPKLSVDLR